MSASFMRRSVLPLVAGGEANVGLERLARAVARDLQLEKVIVFENLGVIERALDHRLGAGLAIALQQIARERASIDADPD
jgi:hypothetical protein